MLLEGDAIHLPSNCPFTPSYQFIPETKASWRTTEAMEIGEPLTLLVINTYTAD